MEPELRHFRLLNVFSLEGHRFSGNPLCVFEDGRGLGDAQMQALARQFNLSETTFLFPPNNPGASARVRIFTPSSEMPFAGHPTLGTAHVVRELRGVGEDLVLEMAAGLVHVRRDGSEWRLRAARPPTVRAAEASRSDFARMLGLPAEAIDAKPLFVDTGVEQLVVPLRDAASVRAATVDSALLARHGHNPHRGESMVYVWAEAGAHVLARCFFLERGGLVEDPATGSACANLGGFLRATGRAPPFELEVRQGEAIGRPSRLTLCIDAQDGIFVAGRVDEVGRGRFAG